MLPGVPLPVCTKSKTITWLDSLHHTHIHQTQHQPNHLHPTPSTTNTHLATSLSQLANALFAKTLESNDTDPTIGTDKETKKFHRLPAANKNTLLLFQLQDTQDQSDVNVLEPNPNILLLINQTSPVSIQTLLHLECARLGLMANFPLGLCTALKNGCLASSPRPSFLNNPASSSALPRTTATCSQLNCPSGYRNRPRTGNLPPTTSPF